MELTPSSYKNDSDKDSSCFILIVAAVVSYLVQTPFGSPIILLGAGLVTALKYKNQPKGENEKLNCDVGGLLLWINVLIFAAILGAATKSLPVKLFENFYRNGSLVFGGGQVLAPLLYTEFVEIENDGEEINKGIQTESKDQGKICTKAPSPSYIAP